MSSSASRPSRHGAAAVAGFLLAAILTVGCAPPPPGPTPASGEGASSDAPSYATALDAPGAPAVVTHLVDGDTLDVRLDGGGTERVRLIGIDTPETKKPDSPVECFGPEASAHLAELVPEGTAVWLLRDAEARDIYGRFLGYLFRTADGLFVNLAMAEGGFADTLSIAPNTTFSSDMSRAVADARRAGLGLWGACPPP